MGLSLDQIVDAITKAANHFLKKDGTNSATANIPMGGFRITGLGNGVGAADAVTVSQLEASQQAGNVRGNIIGAIKAVSGTPKFYYDSNADGATEENASAITGLYLTLESITLSSVTYAANSILKYTGSAWYIDSSAASQGTFDPASTYADVGGTQSNAKYQLTFESYAGHILPNSDTGLGWNDGDRIEWNAAYDTTGDNNIGRWVLAQSQSIVDATNAIKGKVRTDAGIQNLTGVVAVNIDTSRGLSWSDSTTNKPFGLNIISSFFEFVGGALNLKDASVTLAKLAAEVTTLISGKADDSTVVHKTGTESIGGAKTFTSNVSLPGMVLGGTTVSTYSAGGTGIQVESSSIGAVFRVKNTNATGYSGIEYLDNSANIAVFTGYYNGSGEFRFNNLMTGGFIAFKIAGTDRFIINNDGTITCSSTVTVATPTTGGHAVNLTYLQTNNYTKTEVNTLLAGKSDTTHNHDSRYGIAYQTTQNLATNLTSGTRALTALSPLPVSQQAVRVNLNGAALKYGSDFTVNAGTGVITLNRANIGYDVLTTYDVNILYNGIS